MALLYVELAMMRLRMVNGCKHGFSTFGAAPMDRGSLGHKSPDSFHVAMRHGLAMAFSGRGEVTVQLS